MPIGVRKAKTLEKFDRLRVLPLYITDDQRQLYEKDHYKYLIHVLRTQPHDELRILQFLFLKFYPLVVKICKHYRNLLSLDWIDLISYAKQQFIELIYRYDLGSTLFFRTYMPIALSRTIHDYYLYENRRKGVLGAESLDGMEEFYREGQMEDAANFSNNEDEQLDLQAQAKIEIKNFIDTCPKLTTWQREIFRRIYFQNEPIQELAGKLQTTTLAIKLEMSDVLKLVKGHLSDNFL
jgi:RNA polymerase sigma factor (sigma-70 family)